MMCLMQVKSKERVTRNQEITGGIRAITFDVGNTLLRAVPSVTHYYLEVLAEAGSRKPAEELESWKQRDPIEQARGMLMESGLLDSSSDEELQASIYALMDEAEAFAANSPMPETSEALTDIYV